VPPMIARVNLPRPTSNWERRIALNAAGRNS
jgi:hypothetical protein